MSAHLLLQGIQKYRATLLWEKSKVMYFSSDYKDTFEKLLPRSGNVFAVTIR